MSTQPAQATIKLFITYSRRNAVAADALVHDLESRGYEVAIDRRDLPFGEEWQAELRDFILASDTVIWLVSPESIGSRWVNWELGEVQRVGKRLMPVVIAPTPPEHLPDALGKLHLLPSEGVFETSKHLTSLVEALETDRGWIKEHSRLAERARDWIVNGRSADRLLRRSALTAAARWREARPARVPAPSAEILDLLAASERAAKGRLRAGIAALLVLAVGASALAMFALAQRDLARENERSAHKNAAGAFAALAEIEAGRGYPVKATKLALAATARGACEGCEPPPGARRALSASMPLLRERRRLGGHRDTVASIGYSFDGTRIVSGDRAGIARIWEAATGRELLRFDHHGHQVNDAAFTGDGRYLLTRTSEGVLRRIDLDSNDVDGRRLWAESQLKSIAISRNGARLAAGDSEGRLLIFDVETGSKLRSMKVTAAKIEDVAVDADASRVAVTGLDRTALVVDVESGETKLTLRGHEGEVRSLAFTTDGKRLVTGSDDQTARVWDAETGAELARLEDHGGPVLAVAASVMPHVVATGSSDGIARVWDARDGRLLAQLQGHEHGAPIANVSGLGASIFDLAFSPDGSTLASASQDRTARVWDVRGLVEQARFEVPGENITGLALVGPTQWVVAPARPDGPFHDGRIHVWDRKSGEALRGFDLQEGRGHLARIAASPDGKRLAVGGSDNSVALYDVASRRRIARHEAFEWGAISSLAFAPDGSRFATGSGEGWLHLWDGRTGALIGGGRAHDRGILAVAFSPDARLIATGSRDNTVWLWDAATGKGLHAFEGHQNMVSEVAFSPDGEMLATAVRPNVIPREVSVRLWRVRSRTLEAKFEVLPYGAYGLLFSPRGDWLITGSGDGRIYLWDVATGIRILTLPGHDGPISAMKFDASGKVLYSAGGDGTIRAWDLTSIPAGDGYALACAWLPNRTLDSVLGDSLLAIDEQICTETHSGTAAPTDP